MGKLVKGPMHIFNHSFVNKCVLPTISPSRIHSTIYLFIPLSIPNNSMLIIDFTEPANIFFFTIKCYRTYLTKYNKFEILLYAFPS